MYVAGVDSIDVELKENKMTVIGDMDMVVAMKKLRIKFCKVDIELSGPAKEELLAEEEKYVSRCQLCGQIESGIAPATLNAILHKTPLYFLPDLSPDARRHPLLSAGPIQERYLCPPPSTCWSTRAPPATFGSARRTSSVISRPPPARP